MDVTNVPSPARFGWIAVYILQHAEWPVCHEDQGSFGVILAGCFSVHKELGRLQKILSHVILSIWTECSHFRNLFKPLCLCSSGNLYVPKNTKLNGRTLPLPCGRDLAGYILQSSSPGMFERKGPVNFNQLAELSSHEHLK